jgi:UDP-N-acetyl-D-mannosaminuronic acid dehydrogenase
VKFQNICVLGLGYIGLPTASTFATHGVKVVGVDVNPSIVNSLQNGELHIYEPGLRTLVQTAFHSGNLIVCERPEPADAYIIAVPTPFYGDKCADLRAVISAAESIVPVLKRGNLVVLESTSPPLTTRDVVAPILERSGLKAGQDFHLVYSPERVLPGQILRELIENARVIGGIDRISAEAGRDLYSLFVRGQIILTDATTAEMVKLMENTYRDVNIAIANEFSRLADRFGIDAWEAISIANLHPRVNILHPGAGVGGHCISVDPWFLVEAAPEIANLIRMARQVNDSQPHYVVKLVERALGGSLKGKRIAALGLSYKPDVDDMRESPAVEVVHLLHQAGAEVSAYEPFKKNAKLEGVNVQPDLESAVLGANLVLLLVGHTELCSLDPQMLASKMSGRLAVDTTNTWTDSNWQNAGFKVFRLGVGREPGG